MIRTKLKELSIYVFKYLSWMIGAVICLILLKAIILTYVEIKEIMQPCVYFCFCHWKYHLIGMVGLGASILLCFGVSKSVKEIYKL